jgi:hypothetical protein
MRRASTCLAMLGLAVLGLPAAAFAVPTVTFKPIATNNKLGAGTNIQAELTISGTESDGGVPSQLREVKVDSPAGSGINLGAFGSCSKGVLEQSELPEGHLKTKCPKNSIASPEGHAGVVAPIGGELVKEEASLQSFVGPNQTLDFLSIGVAPISATIISEGHFQAAPPPYGKELVVTVPQIPTVPGAANASVTFVHVKVGASLKKGGKTKYLFTVPKKCPKGGFPWRAELTFESGVATTTAVSPCPKGKHK